jgi:NAD(P)-dependent dehydrogenase (short-subunit alcohol dehydrogenase family)
MVTVGRTFLVTGASRGLGRELVECLGRNGHRVIAARRSPATGDRAPAGGISVELLDVTDPASCAALRARLEQAGIQVDVLVNNAGIKTAPGRPWEASAGPLGAVQPDAVEAILRTNVVAPLLVTQALLPVLAPGAVIVNVSSLLASLSDGLGVDYAYNASKAALNMLTVTMQRDLGPQGFTVVSVSPGWVRTDMGGPEAPLDLHEAGGELAALIAGIDDSFAGRYVDRFGAAMRW